MKKNSLFHAGAIVFLTMAIFGIFGHVPGQSYVDGQLYVCVYDSSGIPTFSGDTIFMGNDSLREVFIRHSVYAFDLAFPSVKAIPGEDTYLLDKVYLLKFKGNNDSLLSDIRKFASGVYYYQEKIPADTTLWHPGPDPENPALSILPQANWPDDPLFQHGSDYALDNIRARDAWLLETGTVRIGIADGGVNANHEDLKDQFHQIISNPTHSKEHGTAVAGCAAADTDNGKGKSSIGFDCKLIWGDIYDQNILVAFYNAGARVINYSWVCCAPSIAKRDVVYYLRDQGTLLVAGAGNGTEGPCSGVTTYGYPASYNPVLSVTSVGINDNHIYSPTFYHTHNDQVDVCAPGYGVLSTSFSWDQPNNNSLYSPPYHWGTSFASPIAAGLAGLLYSARLCLNPEEVKYIIESTADNIYPLHHDSLAGKLGHGRINAYHAVKKAKQGSQPVNVTISNDAVWAEDIYISDYLIIERGKTLTIKGDVLFNTNAKLIIEPGATLIVDSGYLRNNLCHGMWKGVEVRGQRDKSQLQSGQQGKIVLQNGAVIKNAWVGVTLAELDSKGDPVYTGSGGIIQADSAFFINNQVAVAFYPYENHAPSGLNDVIDNISYFHNVTFKTETRFISQTIAPDAFVKLYGVRGIEFLGCTFINEIPETADGGSFPPTRGKGIYSHNSSFMVDKRSSASDDWSEFVGLYRGIEAFGTGSLKTFVVDETRFMNVCKAVYAKGITNAAIIRNDFSLFDSQVFLPDMAYGIFLDYCTGYKVEENYITKTDINHGGDRPDHFGIIVSNSLAEVNYIYNNYITLMKTGLLAQGDNRGLDGLGLQIKCNEFAGCYFDIKVMPDPVDPLECGIAYRQGFNNEPSAPAGNRFDRIILPPPETDYQIHSNCDAIIYYHNLYRIQPVYKTHPVDITVTRITRDDTQIDFIPRISCPSGIGLTDTELNQIYSDEGYQVRSLISQGAPDEEIAYHYGLFTQAVNDLGRYYLQDPLYPFYQSNNQLLNLYDGIPKDTDDYYCKSWRYRQVFSYLAVRDTMAASDELTDIANHYNLIGNAFKEHQNYGHLVDILTNLIKTGKSFFELSGPQKTTLSAIALNPNSFVEVYAENIINLANNIPNQEKVYGIP